MVSQQSVFNRMPDSFLQIGWLGQSTRSKAQLRLQASTCEALRKQQSPATLWKPAQTRHKHLHCYPPSLAEESKLSPPQNGKKESEVSRVLADPPQKESKMTQEKDVIFDSRIESPRDLFIDSFWGVGQDPLETPPDTLVRLFEPGKVLTPLPGLRDRNTCISLHC